MIAAEITTNCLFISIRLRQDFTNIYCWCVAGTTLVQLYLCAEEIVSSKTPLCGVREFVEVTMTIGGGGEGNLNTYLINCICLL